MGGAGSAAVDDIMAAYYNPAGILGGTSTELKIGAQTATEGIDKLISTLTGISNPAKFMSDNFANKIDVNGEINAIVGLQFADIGISVMPVSSLSLTKAANSVTGTLNGSAQYDAALTLGTSYTLPGLPIAKLDLGANIKQANMVDVYNSVNVVGVTITGGGTVTNRSGLGFDIGAKASIINLPIPLSVGIAMRDLGETLKGKVQTNSTTYNADGTIATSSVVETNATDYTMPTTTVIGLATDIPGVGLKIAIDLDSISGGTPGVSQSITHYGLEYPVMAGLIALRAGKVSDNNGTIDQTTLGAGINIGLGINVAMMTDNKNSQNNQTMVDFGFAF
jgi:hypothetical protein